MATTAKLYGDIISPYVRICLVAAHELNLAGTVELIATDVRVASINRDLERLSPIAQIPVLATHDGLVLHDSRVIVDYFCDIAEDNDLMPATGRDRHRILTLQAAAHSMADAAVAIRNEIIQRPKELHWREWLDRQQARVEAALDALDTNWSNELATVNVGSLATAVVLSYLDYRFTDWNWRESRNHLAACHDRFTQRLSMQATELPAN